MHNSHVVVNIIRTIIMMQMIKEKILGPVRLWHLKSLKAVRINY